MITLNLRETEREIMEQIERDYEYEYEQELAREVRERNHLAWQEEEADRDFAERKIEDDRSH